MIIINKTKSTTVCPNASLADTVFSRLVGLLNKTSLGPGEGLMITRCRGIHMFFMKFAIDVIFIDKRRRVVGLVKRIKPFRMSPYFLRANSAIEIAPGMIEKTATALGDELEIIP